MAPLLALIPSLIDTVKSYFPPDATPEQKAEAEAKLIAVQMQMQQAVIEASVTAEQELTKRLEADMQSDSWLSKNVRPLVLMFLLVMYTVFAGISIGENNINPVYADMLKDMLMAAFGFYFVSRGIEKVTDKIAAAWGKK
jgi:hypothetical protein